MIIIIKSLINKVNYFEINKCFIIIELIFKITSSDCSDCSDCKWMCGGFFYSYAYIKKNIINEIVEYLVVSIYSICGLSVGSISTFSRGNLVLRRWIDYIWNKNKWCCVWENKIKRVINK